MNLKSLFIKEDEHEPQAAPATTAAPPVKPYAQTAYTPTPYPSQIPTVTVAASDVSNFAEKLRGHFPESPLHGVIDQFHKTMESLKDIIPEEGTRFRSAAKVMETNGITYAKIEEAYQAYIGILQQQASNFKNAQTVFQANEIDSRDATIKQIATDIDAKQQEIASLMSQRDSVSSDRLTAQNKMNTAQSGFEASLATVNSEILDKINKLKLYLNPASLGTTK